MLALDDAALARLCIGATRVRRGRPGRWLRAIAAELDPLCRSSSPMQKECGSILVAPERRSPEYLQKFIQSEIEKWAALIKAANIKAE
jgi:hypothetical protein